MVECEVVKKKELSKELRNYINTDPLAYDGKNKQRDYELISGNRKDQKKIIEEAEMRGMDMEKSLDSDMENDPDLFHVYPYNSIKKVSLILAKSGNSPKLLIDTSDKTLEYRLMHNSFESNAKLDEVTLSKYKSVLKKVMGEKFDIN
ncbi:hypothetical protein OXIME_000909 [Oxyplasma meridianum]|uniref:Uncharacterized protein n=1 Tax=Oxyplasma meridianum TaxID=3073602 RepID=A0AAX4NFQ3_9ARCH